MPTNQDGFPYYCGISVVKTSTNETIGGNVFNFPVSPTSFQFLQRFFTTVTPTVNGIVVDRYGNAPSPIALSGTFGFNSTLNRYAPPFTNEEYYEELADTAEGGIVKAYISNLYYPELFKGYGLESIYNKENMATGWKMTQLLRAIVERSNRPESGLRTYLYVYPLGKKYEVTLNNISTVMDSNTNYLWFYSLSATVLRDATNGEVFDYYEIGKKLNGAEAKDTRNGAQKVKDKASGWLKRQQEKFGTSRFGRGLKKNLKQWDNFVQTSRSNLATVRGTAYELRTLLQDNPLTNVERLLDLPRGSLTNTLALIVDVNNTLTGLQQLGNDFQSTVKDSFRIAKTVGSLLETTLEISKTMAFGSPKSVAAQELVEILADVETELVTYLAVLKADSGIDPDTNTVSGARHTILQGDTLRSIAFKHYDDPVQLWETIKESNPTILPRKIGATDSLDAYIGKVLFVPFSTLTQRSTNVRSPVTIKTILGSDIHKDFSFTGSSKYSALGNGLISIAVNGTATFSVDQPFIRAGISRIKVGTSVFSVQTKTSDTVVTVSPPPVSPIVDQPWEVFSHDISLIEPPEDGVNDPRWANYVTDIMLQSMDHALSVPRGALDEMPNYGTRLSAIVGEVFRGGAANEMLEMAARESFSQDDRIATIGALRARNRQGVVEFDVEFRLIGEEENSPVYRLIANSAV